MMFPRRCEVFLASSYVYEKRNQNLLLSCQNMCPSKFDVIVQCVEELCQFEEKNGEKVVGTPSFALKLGHALKNGFTLFVGRHLEERIKQSLRMSSILKAYGC